MGPLRCQDRTETDWTTGPTGSPTGGNHGGAMAATGVTSAAELTGSETVADTIYGPNAGGV